MKSYSLKNDWRLLQKPLYCDKNYARRILSEEEGWLAVTSLPCDVHMPLMEAGIIGDPNIADNCLRSEWIEERSWWFKKTFCADQEMLCSDSSELFLEYLDVEADLFLNGTYLGHHASAMYPFCKDVRDLLIPGENTLLIRLTAGTEYVSRNDIDTLIDYTSVDYRSRRKNRGEARRTFVRKPQYVYGWDMTPRIATCGIMGDARIDVLKQAVVRNIRFETRSIYDNQADLILEAEIENMEYVTTRGVVVKATMEFDGRTVFSQERQFLSVPGLNFVPFDFTLENPKLWWPNGMGEQNLYRIRVFVITDEGVKSSKTADVGIRTVSLHQEPLHDKEWSFYFRVNGVKFYCKGANMFTLDSIYARVTDENEDKAMREARDAGMNMLRFNGVSAYEKDSIYESCNRYGILVWQDFCYSCGAYPDDREDFCLEAEKEGVYQIRRLRNHPCIALWCGNNECQITVDAYGRIYHINDFYHGDKKPVTPGGTYIYNNILPRLVRQYSPGISYWNSSPFGGSQTPSDPECGDRHFWPTLSDIEPDKDANCINPFSYDTFRGKFSSEFGCIGAPKKSSVQRYYGGSEIDMTSEIWKHHLNTFDIGYVRAGIRKHYTEKEDLTADEYLLYSGLYQGLMVAYGIDSMRYIKDVQGALVWCLTDDWGSVCFSLLDHEINRKIAYYFAKRAFSPVRLILRKNGDAVDLYCTNDHPCPYTIQFECGHMSFTGDKTNTQWIERTIAPFTKAEIIGQIPYDCFDPAKGLIYAAADDASVSSVTLHEIDFKKMELPKEAAIRIVDCHKEGDVITLSVAADVFAHAVHFDLPSEVRLSDDYFDLLPGETKTITIFDAQRIDEKAIAPKAVYVK